MTKPIQGSCLCGQVAYEINGEISSVYQCHCSLCQKTTGGAANAGLICALENLNWLRGQSVIRRYQHENGFRSRFCAACGSPVPNEMSLARCYWIPAGSLDQAIDKQVAAHIFLQSAASWEKNSPSCRHFPEGPDSVAQFFAMLNRSTSPA